MLHAFVYTEVTILVRHWFEINLRDSHLEHGARLELRLREPQPHRGSESASQRIVADRPLWRADLFDRLDAEPGGFDAAHYHPVFEGPEPCSRNWDDAVRDEPWEWLRGQLCDLPAVAAAAGAEGAVPNGDAEQVRADAPAIIAAAQSRAAARCTSAQQCHAWTRDAEHAVHLMLDQLERPELLDRDRTAPWLKSHPTA